MGKQGSGSQSNDIAKVSKFGAIEGILVEQPGTAASQASMAFVYE